MADAARHAERVARVRPTGRPQVALFSVTRYDKQMNLAASTKRGRGRPPTGKAQSAAERMRRYHSFTYTVPAGPTSPPLVSGCPATPVSGQPLLLANCAGFTALRSPEWTINAGIEQKIPLGSNEILLAADTRYQSSSVVAFEMLPGVTEQKAYFTTNLSADFRPVNGNWSLGVYANNLEDNRAIGQALFDNQSNTFASSPMPPRTYGIRTRLTF
ncbi:MAG: TonB-dependent receptor [Gammaproteobacteria bacterium]|nr:TonB-dependent receptor [Gammaproteobacteria bacterium]